MRSTWPGDVVPPRHNPFNGKKRIALDIKLAGLFSLDAFAGGFAVQSLLALWLFERFELSLAVASAFFFWSNVLAALRSS